MSTAVEFFFPPPSLNLGSLISPQTWSLCTRGRHRCIIVFPPPSSFVLLSDLKLFTPSFTIYVATCIVTWNTLTTFRGFLEGGKSVYRRVFEQIRKYSWYRINIISIKHYRLIIFTKEYEYCCYKTPCVRYSAFVPSMIFLFSFFFYFLFFPRDKPTTKVVWFEEKIRLSSDEFFFYDFYCLPDNRLFLSP